MLASMEKHLIQIDSTQQVNLDDTQCTSEKARKEEKVRTEIWKASVLVSAGIELIVFLVAGTVLFF